MLGINLNIETVATMFGGRAKPPFYSDLTFYSKKRIDEFVKNKLDATGDSDAYLTVDPTVDIIDLEKYKPYTIVDGWNTVTFKTIEGDKVYRVVNQSNINLITGGTSTATIENYILEEDIVFNYNKLDPLEKGWLPISINFFNFNGNGHSINNLYINRIESTDIYVGFFGEIKDSRISNIDFINVDISGYGGTVDGVGAIAGKAHRCIINKCSSSGSVYASNLSAGGLIGTAVFTTKIINCHSSCSVDSVVGRSGGLIGTCYLSTPEITKSYAIGSISSDGSGVGAIYAAGNGVLTDCYYLDGMGAIQAGATMLTEGEFKNKTNLDGFDFETVWNIDPLINDGYPYLRNLEGEYVSPFGTLTKIVVTTITIDENKYVVFPDDILINVGTEEDEDLVPLFDRSNSTLYTSNANENAIDWLGVGYEYYWRIDKLNTANILSWMQPDYKFSWFVKNTFTEGTYDPITIKEIMAYNAPITGADNLSKMMKYLGLNIWYDSQTWDDDKIWID